jgi:hypothetical protein
LAKILSMDDTKVGKKEGSVRHRRSQIMTTALGWLDGWIRVLTRQAMCNE